MLSLLLAFPEIELVLIALRSLDGQSLVALSLTCKNCHEFLRGEQLAQLWSARVPNHIRPLPNHLPKVPRELFLCCRRATVRMGQLISVQALKRYKVKRRSDGSVDTCETLADAPPALARWWADVRALLVSGADATYRDSSGQTALHWAVTMGDEAMVLKLLQLGLEPRARANRVRGPNTPGARPVDLAVEGSVIAHMLNMWGRAPIPSVVVAHPQ